MAERVKLSVEDYLAEVLALVEPLGEREVLPLHDPALAGRVLGEPLLARVDVPGFANSAMDGFAVRHEDLTIAAVLREVADVPAGSGLDPALAAGECSRIMTGAPVPSDADTILPRELVEELPDHFGPWMPGVRVNELVDRGRHVRGIGEDFARGSELLGAGRRLDPHCLALAASAGVAELSVVRRPRVAVVATGDELLEPGAQLVRGQIHESNRLHLAHALRRDGAEVVASVMLPDDPDAFAAGLDEVTAGADLVVMSGGVSVGDHDVVRIVLGDRAGGTFRHVQMQPGKPQGWARWNGVPVLGLPGNPLSAAVSYDLFVRPLVERMLGLVPREWQQAVAVEGWQSPPGRRQFIPVGTSVDEHGQLQVRPAHGRGSASHMVSALALADGLAQVPAEITHVNAGEVLLTRSMR